MWLYLTQYIPFTAGWETRCAQRSAEQLMSIMDDGYVYKVEITHSLRCNILLCKPDGSCKIRASGWSLFSVINAAYHKLNHIQRLSL